MKYKKQRHKIPLYSIAELQSDARAMHRFTTASSLTEKRFELQDVNKYRVLRTITVVAALLALLLPKVNASSAYHETISVLQSLYRDEMQAMSNYQAYAKKAVSEKFPNIAKLFLTLAASESVHARNFKSLLSAIGVKAEKYPHLADRVSSTRKNLNFATAVELEEIDNKYPRVLEQIKSENNVEAIQYITYAWESEKQHRELLKKIQSGTGIFFGLLIKRIEGNPYQYFVCQNCGSTLIEIPASSCPICGGPPAKYKEIRLDPANVAVDGKTP